MVASCYKGDITIKTNRKSFNANVGFNLTNLSVVKDVPS